MARRRELAQTAEERSCTKFPVYGNAGSGTTWRPAGRDPIQGSVQGPRVIVTRQARVRAACQARPRKNTETHERGQVSDRDKKEKEREREKKRMRDNGGIKNEEKCQTRIMEKLRRGTERKREREKEQTARRGNQPQKKLTELGDADERSFTRRRLNLMTVGLTREVQDHRKTPIASRRVQKRRGKARWNKGTKARNGALGAYNNNNNISRRYSRVTHRRSSGCLCCSRRRCCTHRDPWSFSRSRAPRTAP